MQSPSWGRVVYSGRRCASRLVVTPPSVRIQPTTPLLQECESTVSACDGSHLLGTPSWLVALLALVRVELVLHFFRRILALGPITGQRSRPVALLAAEPGEVIGLVKGKLTLTLGGAKHTASVLGRPRAGRSRSDAFEDGSRLLRFDEKRVNSRSLRASYGLFMRPQSSSARRRTPAGCARRCPSACR